MNIIKQLAVLHYKNKKEWKRTMHTQAFIIMYYKERSVIIIRRVLDKLTYFNLMRLRYACVLLLFPLVRHPLINYDQDMIDIRVNTFTCPILPSNCLRLSASRTLIVSFDDWTLHAFIIYKRSVIGE